MNKQIFGLIAMVLVFFSLPVGAEGDPAVYCKQAAKLYQENDIAGALEEAKWCLESLEQIQQTRKTSRFPEEVAGWTRGKIEQTKAMGFSSIVTKYSKGDRTIKMSYTSGGGGMGAVFSQMGLAGGKKVRLGRYTGTITEQGSRNEVLIGLKMTPGMLSISTNDASLEALTAFAKAFPVSEIDQ
jgi:hypothetical protein